MKIGLVFSFIFLVPYQYWLYTSLWHIEEEVIDVAQATLIQGPIESIECIRRSRKGIVSGDFLIKLTTGKALNFLSQGTIKDCDSFYPKFDNIFFIKKVYSTEDFSDVTVVGRYVYERIHFEGYFSGAIPLQVIFDDHTWMKYEDMKWQLNKFILFLSLGPISFILIIWSMWFYKKKYPK